MVDFSRFFDDFGVPKFAPRGPKGPPKDLKFEEQVAVTSAGAQGERQNYQTVFIFRLFRFRVLPGITLGALGSPRGPFWATWDLENGALA